MQSTKARWGGLGIGLALAPLLAFSGRSPALHPGAILNVDLTLVPSDAANLACSWNRRDFGYACRYRASGRVEEPAGTLVPAVTTDRKAVLIPDLFRQPTVAARLAQGDPGRFLVQCRVRVLDEVSGVQVRFAAQAPFEPPSKQWLLSPIACQVPPG